MMHDAEGLKLFLPEIALALETEQVRFELEEEMQLQVSVVCNGLTASAEIQLNDEYKLIVRPAIPGFNGSLNWFKWRELTHRQTGEVIKMSQVRCTVSLEAPNLDTDEQPIFSMGIDAPNMEQLVRQALDKIHRHCELKLVALPVVHKKTNN